MTAEGHAKASMAPPHPLPFGTLDLDPQPYVVAGAPLRIRCYVRGCTELLRPPARNFVADFCPVHGIRCHSSGTYSYADIRRNIIIAPDLFITGIAQNPLKFDRTRLGYENSEDALTWNVFRTLQECGLLHVVARMITALEIREEPRLYLWGLSISDDKFEPWDLLIAARQRFESNLPVERPLTEPDIALYLPGYYLILIEAKFTSANPFYTDGPRRNPHSLTKDELLDIFQDPSLQMLDVSKARRADRVYSQLWRNMVFTEWIAGSAGHGTRAYVSNLTKGGQDGPSHEQFHRLMKPDSSARFVPLWWEQIFFRMTEPQGLARVRQYLINKSAGLLPAFALGFKPTSGRN
jgi:hypothetical protein